MSEFGRDLGMGSLRGVHYSRNLKNTDLPKTLDEANAAGGKDVDARYHRLRGALGNVKRVFSDGREAIYSAGELVTSALNGGTYNFINPTSNLGKFGHTIVDVLPYWYFRNSINDPSHIYERLTGYSVLK